MHVIKRRLLVGKIRDGQKSVYCIDVDAATLCSMKAAFTCQGYFL
jgi:hypothetical protein